MFNNFEGLTNLKDIMLSNNKLTAVHPKTFSHLTRLSYLLLDGNICVNKQFSHIKTLTTIKKVEEELKTCGAEYAQSHE
jgi:platelet glycoprotein-5